MPDDAPARRAVVDRLLDDPPVVHEMDTTADPELGVWRTTDDCYAFLADHAAPGTRTLETGCGLSTVLFAALGCRHRCIAPSHEEIGRIKHYCAEREISLDDVVFDARSSDRAVPEIAEPLDLVLLDGCHGFPFPIIDWYYSASWLCRGGLLVLDDLPLPAVRVLRQYIDADPRWSEVAVTPKWAAYRRHGEGPAGEEWIWQPFYRPMPVRQGAFALGEKARWLRAGIEARLRRLTGAAPRP